MRVGTSLFRHNCSLSFFRPAPSRPSSVAADLRELVILGCQEPGMQKRHAERTHSLMRQSQPRSNFAGDLDLAGALLINDTETNPPKRQRVSVNRWLPQCS